MSGHVTAQQIAEALGVTKRNVQIRAQKEPRWMSVSDRVRGGKQNLYPIRTLPDEVRSAVLTYLAKREEATAAAIRAGEASAQRARLISVVDERAVKAAREEGLARFNALPPEQRARADARRVLVKMAQKFIGVSGFAQTRGREMFCHQYNSGVIEVPGWVRSTMSTCSPNSIENWTKALQQEGLARLAGNYGHRKGSGLIDSNPMLSGFCRAMLTEYPHCSAHHVMRGMEARFAAEMVPPMRTLQRWLAAWKAENEGLLLSIANPDGFRSRMQIAAGNLYEQIQRLNQRWEFDSTKGDVMLADGKRHVVVGVIDVWTRRLKLRVSQSSSSTAVAGLLRSAMLDWGVPEQAGTDNGSDYVSNHFTRILDALDIDQDVAPPYTPEHKAAIERSFGTFCRDLIELLPGYIGHDVVSRKAIESRHSFAQRMMREDAPTLSLRMTPEEFQAFCDQWTDNIYNRDAHSSLGGLSPLEKARSWMGEVKYLSDERALDTLLMPAADGGGTRVYGKKGIRIENGWYLAEGMAGFEGQTLKVLVDEADLSAAYLYSMKGEFIGRAICPERAGISRAEIASIVKAEQKKFYTDARADERKNRKAHNVSGIAADILRSKAEQAAAEDGSVVMFPRPALEHVTPALLEAGRAARAEDWIGIEAPPRTDAPAQIIELAPKTSPEEREAAAKDARYRRWRDLDGLLRSGAAVASADREWHAAYAGTAECRARQRAEKLSAG